MVIHRRKKTEKMRGSMTHGWGAKKKHRGSGSRGGKGHAGSGKKGDAKKPSFWNDVKYFGKHGFKKKNIKVIYSTISIRELEDRLSTFLKEGTVKKEGQKYVLKLEDIGYNKLLSNGKVTKQWKLTVPYASKDAAEKINKTGGEVIGLIEESKEEKKDKKVESKKGSEE
jgi:large subunit ribosomal protein L15